MDKEIRVSITARTILTAVLILLAIYLLWWIRGTVLLVLTSVVLASAMEPGVIFFSKRHVPRVISVLFMYVFVFGVLFGFIYFFLPPIINQTAGFLTTIPEYLNTLNLPAALTGAIPLGTDLSQSQSVLQTLLEIRSAFSAGSSQGTLQFLSTIFGGIFSLGLVAVLSFYFAIQETGIEDFLRLVTPSQQEPYILDLWNRARVKIGQWMQGQLIMSLIMSVTIYLGLLLFQIPDALLIAAFTAAAELIPIFGSLIAAIPAVIIAFTSGGIFKAAMVAGLFIVANIFESNLVHPLVVRKVVGVPPLLVILAIIIGGQLAGFLGVLLAVPMAAVLREVVSDFDKRKRRKAREQAG